MPLDTALFTLLHVLVFVYWLGGDLGAFYSSCFLIRPDVSVDRRLLAVKIVGDVDMAPRTALILTFPTGLLLAQSVGYIRLPWPIAIGLCALFLVWLAIAWARHLRHGHAPAWMAPADTILRWSALIAFAGLALAVFVGQLAWPLFLAIKLALLAATIALGLYIRVVLRPLGPAIARLLGDAPAEGERELADTLNRARPLVVLIWACLIAAAFTGLWKPV